MYIYTLTQHVDIYIYIYIYIVTWSANCNLHGFRAGLLSSHNTEKRLLPIHGHPEQHNLLQKEFQLEKDFFLFDLLIILS
jgi:hypothetical protein